jgi:glycosyltransferase involved in cell wall biosynthesis
MKKISLCICFYNAEEFIERALDSFVQFLTDEIEVILVDDGSNDNSLEIVKSYVLKYNQMKIVQHQKNKGLSLARKTAVDHSTANHLMFLDADDEFIKNPFALFLNNKELHSFDVIEYGAITDKNEVYLNKSYRYGEIIEASIYLNDYFKFKKRLCYVVFEANEKILNNRCGWIYWISFI